jgi:hypothetical protein
MSKLYKYVAVSHSLSLVVSVPFMLYTRTLSPIWGEYQSCGKGPESAASPLGGAVTGKPGGGPGGLV